MSEPADAVEAEAEVKQRLADLFESMGRAQAFGVNVEAIMGEIARHAIAQAEAAGEQVSPIVKMLFG